MELLAPAGNREALEAALRGGADAVYLGYSALNARRGAGNFDADGLLSAARYCHERGARVYVTVNTLIKDGEYPILHTVARALADAGVDGAIVQDLGVFAYLRDAMPTLPLHASTQMAVRNVQGVRALRAMGAKRVVLAREMSYEEIAACAGEGVALEVFGHGALCVAASGLCLFSSMVGGRSGNRGLCAQPCRLPYTLRFGDRTVRGALLSAKDFSRIGDLVALQRAGVASLKLEGRLKSPDYVYAVTRAYRAALDGEAPDHAALNAVFNRGYTRGYVRGFADRDIPSVDDETHVEPGEAPPKPPDRRIPIAGTLYLSPGEPAIFTVSDGADAATVSGDCAETALTPCDTARYAAQLEKTGDTPYRFASLAVDAAPDAFLRVSQVNALRREALTALGALRAQRRRGCDPEVFPVPAPEDCAPLFPGGSSARAETVPGKPTLAVESGDAVLLDRALSWGADELLFAPDIVPPPTCPSAPFALVVPPVLTSASLDALHDWALMNADRISGVRVSNIAHVPMSWPGIVRADYPMNLMNARAICALGLPCAPSPELNVSALRALPGAPELIVYGRIPLMILSHCPLNARAGSGAHAACRRCDAGGLSLADCVLTDRMNARFPLRRLKTPDGCIIRLYNSVPLMLLRKYDKLPPAAIWRITLTDEDETAARLCIQAYRAALDGTLAPSQIPDMPSTTGHYFRGVD